MSDKKRNYNYLIQDFAMLLFIITDFNSYFNYLCIRFTV